MTPSEHRVWVRIIAAASGLCALVGLLAGGCSSEVVPVTPTPTRTKAPTATPAPTASPLPTATSTPEITLTPTPTPIPENVNPLTGLSVDDPAKLERVPVALKISNWPGEYVRPQAGINDADIIYEHYNEGWFATRWTAIYLGNDPERVGPIRSGRLIDLELPAIYKAVLACSGFSNGVLEIMRNSDLYPERIASPSVGVGQPVFYRDTSRNVPLEHTMYSNPKLVREWAEEQGVSGRQELEHLVFSEGIPDGGSPATTIQLAWNRLDAEWRYGEDLGRYLRWTDGQPHMDALSGEQLNVANVVVLYVPQWNTDIVEDPHGGALSIQFALWDSNQAILFRDGVQIEAFWQRWEREDMLILTDAEGEPVALKPGNTFYQVLPTEGHEVEIVIDPEN